MALIICAIFGRQKWFAARLSGNMYWEASADDDPNESVNEVRWKLKKKMVPFLICLAIGIPIAFAIRGDIPWWGVFVMPPAIVVIFLSVD